MLAMDVINRFHMACALQNALALTNGILLSSFADSWKLSLVMIWDWYQILRREYAQRIIYRLAE